MARQLRNRDLVDDLAIDGSVTAGQSGDTQGLSSNAEAAGESVEELADAGQDYEADVVLGLEDAADHPEQPVPTHQKDPRPPGPDRD